MTTFKSKMIALEPKQKRKANIAMMQKKVFTNPLIGAAMAEDQFRDQGGKMHRVRDEKLWARTRY